MAVLHVTPLNNSDTAAYFRGGENGGAVPIDFPMRIVELQEEGPKVSPRNDFSRGDVDGGVWIMASVSRINWSLNELETASGRGLY